ncbi:MAG TPA: hypothetical protein VKX17_25410 [Planctomycetota bacterium]|nr:hypothetical protein [Planctomycetota bacterium]
MPLPPISVQLTNFQQIEILRDQIEEFEEELKKTEARIREALYQVEKQRYLTALHPVFQHTPPQPDVQALPELHEARETLSSAVETMKAALAQLESVTGAVPRPPRPQAPAATRLSGVAPSAPAPGASSAAVRRNRFDAF